MATLAQLKANPKDPARDGQKAYNDWLKQVDAAAKREQGGYIASPATPATPVTAAKPVSDPRLDAVVKQLDKLTQSVSTASMIARAGVTPQGSPTPVAQGFDLQQQMFQNLLLANADRRAAVDQTMSTINMLAELEWVSPTRAASFAAAMGLGDGPDLSWVNDIGSGALARISGRAGNQSISLPMSLSGKDLSFLSANPNVATAVQDVADALGLPDIFARSSASAIPASRSLLALAGG